MLMRLELRILNQNKEPKRQNFVTTGAVVHGNSNILPNKRRGTFTAEVCGKQPTAVRRWEMALGLLRSIPQQSWQCFVG